MLKNYVKLTFRNFKKRKGHTFINIFGLAIAIACCIVIGLYVQHELSYDTFLDNGDRLYRVTQTSITPEKTEKSATTPPLLGTTLESEYPRLVENMVRLYNTLDDEHTFILRSDTAAHTVVKSFLEPNFFFADSTFFEVFGYKLIRGNPETVLDKPLSLVITPEKARKFFGDEDPIGKNITFESRSMNMTVTGIMEPLPENAHFKADILASFNSLNTYFTHPENFYNDWFKNNIWTYVLLKKGVQPEELSRQFPAFAQKYYAHERDKNETFEMSLQPVKDIHLYSDLELEIQPNGSIFYVYLFSTAVLLLLIIACINFMNLATARAAERSREVGMRKALGAGRGQLFLQFMGEAFILSFMALLVALLLVAVGMPFFNDFIGEHLVFNFFNNNALLIGIPLLFLIIGMFAGAYPALYLSGFKPRQILQGEVIKGRRKATLRKVLVVIQFCMSVILIIGTIIVFLQLRHMQQKNLGFDKDHLVIMPIRQNLIAWEYPSFKQRAEQSGAITSVTGTGKILGAETQDLWRIAPAGKAGTQGETNHALWVTHDFVKTFGLEVIAGRAFSKNYSTDGQALLINQQMVQKLGYDDPEKALGELFYYTTQSGTKNPLHVIGVVKDFNYTSIKNEIKPTVICLADNEGYRLGAINFAAAKIAPGRTQEGLAHLENIWSEINFIDPFNYSFQDAELEKIYASEATTSSIMAVFTVLCIVVACLGLFGLASFTASKRTKEIGIRKSLGASVGNIVMLLYKEYVKLVLIANIIAWPVIYYVAYKWLQDFPYRVTLSWNMVLICVEVGVLSLLICLASVSYQSIKAALINPVESIRQE